jgi:hypothetical protein
MAKYLSLAFFFLFAASLFVACTRKNSPPEDPAVWNKVKIDFSKIDEKGLAGPPNGKVAVNYEFCIPAEEKFWSEVKNIDKTAQAMKGSKGRIGCDKSQWLVVGSTHQENYKRVIYELAALTYVQKIQETFFE